LNTRSLSGGVRIVTRILVSILSAPSAYMYRNTAHHITKRVSGFLGRSPGPSHSTHMRTRQETLLPTNCQPTVRFGAYCRPGLRNENNCGIYHTSTTKKPQRQEAPGRQPSKGGCSIQLASCGTNRQIGSAEGNGACDLQGSGLSKSGHSAAL